MNGITFRFSPVLHVPPAGFGLPSGHTGTHAPPCLIVPAAQAVVLLDVLVVFAFVFVVVVVAALEPAPVAVVAAHLPSAPSCWPAGHGLMH